MKISANHLKRYREIIRLLWKYGRSDLVEQLRRNEGFEMELEDPPTAESPALPEQLADDLEAMGPTYIKLGQVLAGRPEEVVGFLLETSILDRLIAGLCDAVTGRADGQEMLEALESANLFLVPLDDERCWYRYHHLFAEFLRARLTRERPGRVAELHRAAAAWCERQGLIEREPSDEDRRVVYLRLSAKGAKALEKLARLHRDELRSLRARFIDPALHNGDV